MVDAVDEIDIDLLIDRSGLALGDLNLSQVNAYEVVDFGPGPRTYRRRKVEGPYQDGDRLISAKLNTRSLTGVVRVYGSSWAQVRSRATTMFRALEQRSYEITATIDGVTDTYLCEPADIVPGNSGTWQKAHLMARMQEYSLAIPYDPTGSLA